MAIAKQTFEPKFPLLRYPLDAKYISLNPDKYSLWKEPKDWRTVRSEIVAVTAKEALAMFKRANPSNATRRKDSQVNNIRGWIAEGIYALMDTVEFDWDGVLQNGHHRLEAISLSDGIVILNVVYGVNPDNYSKYDDNYKRTASNIVGIKYGLSKSKSDPVAAALKWAHVYWSGEPLESRMGIHGRVRVEYLEAKPDMLRLNDEIDAVVKRTKKEPPCAKAVLLSLLTLGCEVANGKGKTREFIEDVIVGDGLKSGSPAYEYREWLMNNRDSKGKRVYTSLKMGLGLIALRAHIEDRSLTPLRINTYNSKKGVPRLSQAQDEFFEELAEEARQCEKNKLLTKVNPTNKYSTPLADFDFFGKRTLTALAKNEIITFGDLALVNNEVTLRKMVSSKAFVEVKDFVSAMELPTVKQ